MDGADTGIKTSANDTVAFKFVVNDYYAKDISLKVSCVKAMKASQGKFQGNTAPYGYKKMRKNKHKLVIDKNVSHVIKRIFDLYITEKSSSDIAVILTEEKIPCPAKYLDIPKFRNDIDQWTGKSIVKIITNQVYIGNMVGLKTKKISYKVDKYIANKKENLVIIEKTHEPIVTKKIFDEANKILAKKRVTRTRKHDDILKGFLYCNECGSVMTLKVKNEMNQRSYLCSKANKGRKYVYKPCENYKSISSPKAYKKLIEVLRDEFAKIEITEKDIEQSANNILKKSNINKENVFYKIEKIKNKILEIDNETDSLYKDKVKQVITTEDFSRMYENIRREKSELQEKIEELEKEMENKNNKPCFDIKEIKKLLIEFLTKKEPSKELLYKLVDKIEMDRDKNLTIRLNFH